MGSENGLPVRDSSDPHFWRSAAPSATAYPVPSAIFSGLPFFHLGSRVIALPQQLPRRPPAGRIDLDGMMTFGWTRAALVLASVLGSFGAAHADRIKNPTAVFSGLDKITGRIVSFEVGGRRNGAVRRPAADDAGLLHQAADGNAQHHLLHRGGRARPRRKGQAGLFGLALRREPRPARPGAPGLRYLARRLQRRHRGDRRAQGDAGGAAADPAGRRPPDRPGDHRAARRHHGAHGHHRAAPAGGRDRAAAPAGAAASAPARLPPLRSSTRIAEFRRRWRRGLPRRGRRCPCGQNPSSRHAPSHGAASACRCAGEPRRRRTAPGAR